MPIQWMRRCWGIWREERNLIKSKALFLFTQGNAVFEGCLTEFWVWNLPNGLRHARLVFVTGEHWDFRQSRYPIKPWVAANAAHPGKTNRELNKPTILIGLCWITALP